MEREVAARQDHGGEGRIKAARFPARKTLEDFDFSFQRSLKREVVAHLGTLDFVTGKANVVFLGPPGTGKTHLAIGLGIRACQAGHRVAFATAAEWVARLGEAHSQGRLHDELRSLGRVPLLVVDEVGYIPFEAEAANLFFQLVSSRYERASVIVTSNKPFGRWGEVMAPPTDIDTSRYEPDYSPSPFLVRSEEAPSMPVGEIDPDAWFTPAQVAELCGVHPRTISRWHRRGWLPARLTPGGRRRYAGVDVARHLGGDPTQTHTGDVPLVTAELLEDLYVRQGLTQRIIAHRLGIHQRTVWAALRAAGIPAPRRGSWVLAGGPDGLPRERLEDLYVQQSLSLTDVAGCLGVRRETVRKHLIRAGPLGAMSIFPARPSRIST